RVNLLHGPIGATPFADATVFSGAGAVYAGTEVLPNFFARDPRSGGSIFNTTVGSGALLTTPVRFNNLLYFSDVSGVFHGARADNGDAFWSFSVAPDNVNSAALVATIGGRTEVYFGTAHNNRVFALDPQT